jgi:hypothetical protein
MLKNQRKGTYQLRHQSSQLPPSVGSPRFARGTAQGFGSPRFARGTAQGFGSPCGQGEPEGGGRQLPFLVNFGAAIGVSPL